jgi:hypothetical protein
MKKTDQSLRVRCAVWRPGRARYVDAVVIPARSSPRRIHFPPPDAKDRVVNPPRFPIIGSADPNLGTASAFRLLCVSLNSWAPPPS